LITSSSATYTLADALSCLRYQELLRQASCQQKQFLWRASRGNQKVLYIFMTQEEFASNKFASSCRSPSLNDNHKAVLEATLAKLSLECEESQDDHSLSTL